ncbi:hypothetical protein AMTRI_Chr06g173620 [Amborella trichopoda]|uniref:GPI transamidase component PIG-S n=1 Tax=Amborella trichopoda TaxID=13333 RepID=W1PVQ5_AMBTC|nr:GPI transamidase component PIG-S [Amborella trichopoda]XP_020526535.1 GPI transamidase component PIG-S [Amborella trichopoda]ERN11909.1 hypothetical protein AMTR_s00020p00225970 [Amborella trichopoda]|eukprot:XP_006850328.1 GPI transamidase component PIG-S [Amborella trichopoda]
MAENMKQQQQEPDICSRTTLPGSKRLLLTLYVFFSFIIGAPFFLKSRAIYRAPLPFKSIESLDNHLSMNPLLFPCHFHTVFLGFGQENQNMGFAQELEFLMFQKMQHISGSDRVCGGCGDNYSVSVTVDYISGCFQSGALENEVSWPCGSLDLSELEQILASDAAFDEYIESFLQRNGGLLKYRGNAYRVVVVNREMENSYRTVIGKHRHAWIYGKISEGDAVSLAAQLFVNFFMNGGIGEGLFSKGKGEFMPIAADGSVVLSFSLLNANPNDWVFDWDFRKIDEIFLSPVVKALAPLANISVESQILYHTPKASYSYWDENLASYIFSTNDLPFFVNSNEWYLDTSVGAAGQSKILHFVVYVPSADECPLVLQLPDGTISSTNGFMSPTWGGIIVWNPTSCSTDSRSARLSRHTFSSQDLVQVMEVFMGQLRLLFGLKSYTSYDVDIQNIVASEKGFAEWELDVLVRHHAAYNLFSSATTLQSLSKLVQSLPSMIVMDEIGKQVKLSLEAANLAENNASLGMYDAAEVSSREARVWAEAAFFHPSIMSILYFPFEHHVAIYSPFFVPVAMHVFIAAFKETMRYRREREKYWAWKNQAPAL